MYEFVDKLNLFLKNEGHTFELRLQLHRGRLVLWFFEGSGYGQNIEDTENFEEEVYKRVKKWMEDHYGK